MLDRLEFKRTPKQQFGLMLVGCVLVAGSWYLATTTPDPVYRVVGWLGVVFLALTFNDPARILSRVSTARRKWALANERLRWGHWSLTFIGLTPGIDEAVAFISEHSLVQPAMVKR